MSRIGKMPIIIPSGVNIIIDDVNNVTVKGPKGELKQAIHKDIKITIDGQTLKVERISDSKLYKSLHGLSRSLINNMVEGVTKGYQKRLQISGVGYRAQKQGKKLVLAIGFSHPIEIDEENGIEIEVPEVTKILVKGIDKQKVGAVAAKIRNLKRPDPYQGKGITYENEKVLRKVGKTGK